MLCLTKLLIQCNICCSVSRLPCASWWVFNDHLYCFHAQTLYLEVRGKSKISFMLSNCGLPCSKLGMTRGGGHGRGRCRAWRRTRSTCAATAPRCLWSERLRTRWARSCRCEAAIQLLPYSPLESQLNYFFSFKESTQPHPCNCFGTTF